MAPNRKSTNSLKALIKSALSEMIEENEELVKRVFEEAIEDAFLSHAIKQGKKTRKINRQQVFEKIAQLTK